MELKRLNNNREVVYNIANNKVPYFSFKALDESGLVKHAFSTKEGGFSTGFYKSMNLSFSKNDDKDTVKKNFKKFSEAIDIEYESLCLSSQTHTTNVAVVDAENRGNGILHKNIFSDIDALVTNSKNITLVCLFADCIPIYFLDTKNKAIGLAHSGWRGTLANISKATINIMSKEFSTKVEDIIACVGIGICKDCYEVSKDLYDNFSKVYTKNELSIIFTVKNEEKYNLDLLEANKINLLNIGVKENNIHIADVCTACNENFLFSHRKMGDKRGNLAAFMALK